MIGSVRAVVPRVPLSRPGWSLRRAELAIALLLGAAALGCGRSRAGQDQAAGAARAGAHAPGLTMSLGLAGDERSMDVEIRVTGPKVAEVRDLVATRGWADTHPFTGVRNLDVRDAGGTIEVKDPVDDGAFSRLPLARPPAGDELTVRYTARANAEVSRLALHRGAGGVSGVGHAFVVRPVVAGALPFTMRFHAGGLASGASLVTSLDGRASATVEDLAEAVYVAGSARSEALPEGDRATIAFGSAIDGAAAIDVTSRVRAFATRAFGLEPRELGGPVSLFVIGERGIGREHDGASTGGAVAVWLDGSRSLDGAAKVLIAHEAFHRVFGAALRVGIEGYEATWFAEGFATHFARRALFEQGLLDAEAFLADVARTEAESAPRPGDHRAAEYGRGSRYAATIDAAVRARSRGARSLDDVVRALAVEARKTPDAPLPVETFRAAVVAEVGPDKERALWEALASKEPLELPDGAFGPCFHRAIEARTTLELGFDAASLSASPQIIRGTVPGSAAARAGVRDGALVLKTSLRPGQEIAASTTVQLVLGDSRGKRNVSYRPAATRKRAVFKAQSCKR